MSKSLNDSPVGPAGSITSEMVARLAIQLRIRRRQPSLRQKIVKPIHSYHRRWIKESASLFRPEEGKHTAIVGKKLGKRHARTQSEVNSVSKPNHQRWLTSRQPTQPNENLENSPIKGSAKHSRQSSEVTDLQCSLCCAALANSLYAPCGHGGLCHACGSDVMSRTGICCFCRCTIISLLTVTPSTDDPRLFEATAGYVYD